MHDPQLPQGRRIDLSLDTYQHIEWSGGGHLQQLAVRPGRQIGGGVADQPLQRPQTAMETIGQWFDVVVVEPGRMPEILQGRTDDLRPLPHPVRTFHQDIHCDTSP